jgi:hypothetical protein
MGQIDNGVLGVADLDMVNRPVSRRRSPRGHGKLQSETATQPSPFWACVRAVSNWTRDVETRIVRDARPQSHLQPQHGQARAAARPEHEAVTTGPFFCCLTMSSLTHNPAHQLGTGVNI